MVFSNIEGGILYNSSMIYEVHALCLKGALSDAIASNAIYGPSAPQPAADIPPKYPPKCL